MSESKTGTEPGAISRDLMNDHRRLDKLFWRAVAHPDRIDHAAYDAFRSGLLRHIGLEEKILLPALQRLRGGEPVSIASKLRLEHGALAALLMPTPTSPIIAAIRAILDAHNALEEGHNGLYATCDKLIGPESDALLTRLDAAPEVAVMPCSDSPTVIRTVRKAVTRAGYDMRDFETGITHKECSRGTP